MSGRILEVNGRKVWVLENGGGAPLLYLHGFADLHSVKESWLPFHERLAKHAHVIAPAHPGCAQTDENKDIDVIEDVVFHYLEVLDMLKLTQLLPEIQDYLAAIKSGKPSRYFPLRKVGQLVNLPPEKQRGAFAHMKQRYAASIA